MSQTTAAAPHPEVAALIDAMRGRRRRDVNRHTAALLDQGVHLGAQWASIATAAAYNGEVALALVASERAIAQTDSSPAARFQHAVLLAQLGRPAEAHAIAAAIPTGAIPPAQREHFLGTCAMEASDFDAAQRHFEVALAHRPGSGPTWLSLVSILDDPAVEALWDRLRAAEARIEPAPENRAPYLYARGAAAHIRRDVDRAFGDFAAGAALIAPLRPFDAAADRRHAEMVMAGAAPARSGTWEPDPRAPIHVLGHPRSGTTLVEQLLAGTGGAVAGGELNLMRIVADEAGGMTGAHADGHERPLRELLDRLLSERLGPARVIDKSLNNSRFLGLIAAVAPGAPIIRVRRRPVDAAWSCFRTYFSQGVPWSWSLDSIAAHFLVEEELLAFWSERLGAQMLTIDYEALVAEPEAMTARLAAHCGLDASPAAPSAAASVRTASVAQVRRPITARAVGAAEPYRAHLAPLYDALGG